MTNINDNIRARVRDVGADIPVNPPYTQEELQADREVQKPGEQVQINISPGAPEAEPIRFAGERVGTTTGDYQRILDRLPSSPGEAKLTVGGEQVAGITVDDVGASDEGTPEPFQGQPSVGVAGGRDALPDDSPAAEAVSARNTAGSGKSSADQFDALNGDGGGVGIGPVAVLIGLAAVLTVIMS
jgi:hypothetical protein